MVVPTDCCYWQLLMQWTLGCCTAVNTAGVSAKNTNCCFRNDHWQVLQQLALFDVTAMTTYCCYDTEQYLLLYFSNEHLFCNRTTLAAPTAMTTGSYNRYETVWYYKRKWCVWHWPAGGIELLIADFLLWLLLTTWVSNFWAFFKFIAFTERWKKKSKFLFKLLTLNLS